MEKTDFTKTEYYRNRELSWLAFNERVLSEARDKSIPLFERLKFLSITASNLDEFFMIRVASLKDMVNANYTKKDIARLRSSSIESERKRKSWLAFSIPPIPVLCFRCCASMV